MDKKIEKIFYLTDKIRRHIFQEKNYWSLFIWEEVLKLTDTIYGYKGKELKLLKNKFIFIELTIYLNRQTQEIIYAEKNREKIDKEIEELYEELKDEMCLIEKTYVSDLKILEKQLIELEEFVRDNKWKYTSGFLGFFRKRIYVSIEEYLIVQIKWDINKIKSEIDRSKKHINREIQDKILYKRERLKFFKYKVPITLIKDLKLFLDIIENLMDKSAFQHKK